MAKITGGCACGAIRYETDADPLATLNCHCRDCQRASGSAFAAVMALPKAAVTLTGEPRYYKAVGNAGRAVERGFCAVCGSPVTVKLERFPDMLGIQAASLDDPALYKPAIDLFTDRAWAWVQLPAETQKQPQGM